MFDFGYNYVVLYFLNAESIVMICFFFFFFFALMSDKGKFGTSLQEISVQSRLKFYKQLAVREEIIQNFVVMLDS